MLFIALQRNEIAHKFAHLHCSSRPWDACASTANLAQGPELLPCSHPSADTTSSHTTNRDWDDASMTYLLVRQRCCLCGDGVGTTQLLQLWCHHAAALLGSVQCRFLPADRLSQNSETQTTSRANDITTKTPEVRLLQRFKHMPRKLPLMFATAKAVMHVRRSSHVKS